MVKLHKIWTRDYDVYLCYGASIGLYNNSKLLLYGTKKVFIFPEGKNRTIYLTGEDYRKQWKALEQSYVDKPENFIKHVGEVLRAGEEFVKKCMEYSKGVSQLDDKELAKRFMQFERTFSLYFIYLWSTFIINELISDRIMREVDKLDLSKEEKQKLLHYATQPRALSSVLLLNEEAKKKNVKQLAREFAWITTLNIYDNPATEEDIKNRITKKDEEETTIPENLNKLDKGIQKLIEASRENSYIKDKRDDYRRMGTYYIIPLYEEIGKRLGLSRKELAFLTFEEIKEGLLGNAEDLKGKARTRQKNGFMMYWHDNKLDFEDDIKKINEIKRKYRILVDLDNNVKEFKGVIGCKGKVFGKVKVVLTAKELGKIEKGDILVSITTNPDYLLGMKKAIAFITDEGGITSHAAIIAREMNKPCIVGTKIATRVLSDGDEVEVNANHGVVTKIN